MKQRKILIDARWYGLEQRGIGRYVKEMIDGLVKYQNSFDIVLIVSKNNFDIVPKGFQKVIAKSRWYTLYEQIEIPRIIEKIKPDIFHATHINVPLLCSVPYIVTVHDLQLLRIADQRATTLPKPIFYIKTVLAKYIVSRAIKFADKIIAVSKFTADEITALVKHRHGHIYKILEGTTSMSLKNYRPNLLNSLKITKPFFIYCGAAYPHKNVELLIDAFVFFNQQNENRYQLVLVGKIDYFYQRIQNQTFNHDVIFTGFLPDNDLMYLYKQCLSFVIASVYEGFGLSPLEAQACGAPVLSARAGSLPEVLGDSALYFDNKRDDMVLKMEEMVNNDDLRTDLINKGYKNNTRFSWQTMVDEIVELYK